MGKIKVLISWSGNNYCATSASEDIYGCVVITNKELEAVKKEFIEGLQFHIEGCLQDGDVLPEWVAKGEYEIDFEFSISALLHSLDKILTRAAISRATGINERQLGHYASGHRNPRPEQQKRIINGIHQIGRELAVV